ncbi:hypothetical protein Syncc9902_0098 [Synechococcus sp. CC9902]|uniref:hypothetical protein n=1 Tax=Synechococcus sp. (strain CC9902) TaxID=316279 RepID=UPI00005D3CFB|nr:hypothetical protein [Synechococcus sp. CC9902]ABB25073.1 hypothetical protein Syncc9902_0098 [Synechococcus sp. CC9902]
MKTHLIIGSQYEHINKGCAELIIENTDIANDRFVYAICSGQLEYCFVYNRLYENIYGERPLTGKGLHHSKEVASANISKFIDPCKICNKNQIALYYLLKEIKVNIVIANVTSKIMQSHVWIDKLVELIVNEKWNRNNHKKNNFGEINSNEVEYCIAASKSSIITTYYDVFSPAKHKRELAIILKDAINLLLKYKELIKIENISSGFIFNGRMHNVHIPMNILLQNNSKVYTYECSEEWGLESQSYSFAVNTMIQDLDERSAIYRDEFNSFTDDKKKFAREWASKWLDNRVYSLKQVGSYPQFSGRFEKSDNTKAKVNEKYDFLILPTSEFEYAGFDKISKGPLGTQLDAYMEIAEKFPNASYAVRLHPNSSNRDEEYIQKLCSKLTELIPSIKIYEPASTTNTYNLIRDSKIVVSGFSLALIEAIHIGKKVITTTPSLYSAFIPDFCLTKNHELSSQIRKGNKEIFETTPSKNHQQLAAEYAFMLNNHIRVKYLNRIKLSSNYRYMLRKELYWYN